MTRREPIEAARRIPRAAGGLHALVRVVAPMVVASVAVLLIAFTVAPAEARAAGPGKHATTLQLQMPTTVKLGDHPVARVRLVSGSVPVRGALVSVRLGGQVTLQLKTGADGTASGVITRDLSAGRYQATATFAGTPTYQSSASKAVTFTVQPVRLTIATVPATAGIPIVRIGSTTLTTGADGTATVTMKDVGKVALRLALPADDATRQLRLDRWDDGSTGAVRTIRIPDTLDVVAALQVRHPVQLSFVASDGSAIDPAKVEVTGIADDAGNDQALSGPGPHWLASNAITRLTTGLASSPVGYRITQVMVDGQNVVNRGQQRFAVDAPLALKVDVLVFDLIVQGRDALLKSPRGTQVTVIAPSGESTGRGPRPGLPRDDPAAARRVQALHRWRPRDPDHDAGDPVQGSAGRCAHDQPDRPPPRRRDRTGRHGRTDRPGPAARRAPAAKGWVGGRLERRFRGRPGGRSGGRIVGWPARGFGWRGAGTRGWRSGARVARAIARGRLAVTAVVLTRHRRGGDGRAGASG